MKLLSELLAQPIEAFEEMDYIFHYFKPSEIQAPYGVWIEGPEESFSADNAKAERTLTCTMEFYSQTEADSKIDEIEAALITMGASWTFVGSQYEEETALIHYSWEWSVS